MVVSELGRILLGPYWDGGIFNKIFKEIEEWTMAKSFLSGRMIFLDKIHKSWSEDMPGMFKDS